MSSKYIWNEKLIEKLIELYKHHPCLYDAKMKDYHNRDLKRQNLEEIATELNTISKFSDWLHGFVAIASLRLNCYFSTQYSS